MAEGKLDLFGDLGSSKSNKDDVAGGKGVDKVLVGFPDESKDRIASESSIPLSPQWLHSKPVDSKDSRFLNSSMHGSNLESVQKDAWRLDGSQEKWKRNVPDVDVNRRWREEERDTGLLSLRERRKEGERENEYRKSERRSENVMRDPADSRTLSSSDWRHENRNSGIESRRDSKWSLRWGPEEKEKDSRTEKKIDVDKEDIHVEKHSSVATIRPLSESDSRDKWRPRHRQEVHSVGSAQFRAAPGFGLERGRGDGSNPGFAPGRGRSKISGGLTLGKSSATGPIGAAPVNIGDIQHGKFGLSTYIFRYPRGKLLDIYKHKILSTFDTVPEDLAEVPMITKSSYTEPFAFSAPDTDEEAILQDIWKGRIISSEEYHDSFADKIAGANDHNIDSSSEKYMDKVGALLEIADSGEMNPKGSKNDTDHHFRLSSGMPLDSELKVTEEGLVNDDAGHMGLLDFLNNVKPNTNPAASFDIRTELPEDSNSLFDTPYIQEIPDSNRQHSSYIQEIPDSNRQHSSYIQEIPDSNRQHSSYIQEIQGSSRQHQSSDAGIKLPGHHGTPPEEFSLFYRDPQGEIQGPFLGVDIISWFEQGFFGIDLPVCLSDAPEGTLFQPLGELMPHLSLKSLSTPMVDIGEKSEPVDTARSNLVTPTLPSYNTSHPAVDEQELALASFDAPHDHQAQPKLSMLENVNLQYGRVLQPNSDTSEGIGIADRQSFHDFPGQEIDGDMYTGISASGVQNPSRKLVHNLHNLSQSPSGQNFLESKMEQTNLSNREDSVDNNLNPLGLFLSELEGNHQKRPLSSIMSEQGNVISSGVRADSSHHNHRQESYKSIGDHDLWLNSYNRRNVSPNILEDPRDVGHLSHFEQGFKPVNFQDQMVLQQLQKQQLHRHNLLSADQGMHMNSHQFVDDMQHTMQHQQVNDQHISEVEHLLQLRFEQQRRLQLLQKQQQQQLQQQQHLQQQQQLQQLQQQLHPHHMQLLEQQQRQQLLIKQLQQQQLHDSVYGTPHGDPLRGGNMLDQFILRQQLLHESHQQPHHLPHHPEQLIEQLIQAKFGESHLRDRSNDILGSLSNAKHKQMLSLEQEYLRALQQEQMQARQLPPSSGQHLGMEEERHIGGSWTVDESNQFLRSPASQHQLHSAGPSHLDFIQAPARTSSFENPNQLELNLLLQEQMRRGLYEAGAPQFERPSSRSASSPTEADFANVLARFQGLDMHEQHVQEHFSGQMAQFPRGLHSQQHQVSDHFPAPHLDARGSHWSDLKSEMDPHLIQLHLEVERQKRREMRNHYEEDPNAWASLVGNDVNPNSEVMNSIHQKFSLQSPHSFQMADSVPTSFENREPSRHFSSAPADGSINLADSMNVGRTFLEGSRFPDSGHLHDGLANMDVQGDGNDFVNFERLGSQSGSGSLSEQRTLLRNADVSDKDLRVEPIRAGASLERDFSDSDQGRRLKKRDSKGKPMSGSFMENIGDQTGGSFLDNAELKVNTPVRHASFGVTGGNVNVLGYETVLDNGFREEISNNRMPGIHPEKGGNNMLIRTPDSDVLTSQAALPDLAFAPPVKGKKLSNSTSDDLSKVEGRRNTAAAHNNVGVQDAETSASNKRDTRFRRTTSGSDADAPEASFMEMLKSNKKPPRGPDAPVGSMDSDAGPGGKNNSKKKGKKGKQIDPSLLGFRVHSNRIMMGEIQRLDD